MSWWLYCFRCAILVTMVSAQAQNRGLIGVNWGTQLSHPLHAPDVVEMLKANNVARVKLFEADPTIMKALGGSGLEVMVGIPNDMLQMLSDVDKAHDWVENNVTQYYRRKKESRVNIKYVAVGNEPFLQAYNKTYEAATLPAMKNVQAALSKAKLSTEIVVTVPLNADVLQATDPSFLPSSGVFRNDIKQPMQDIVQFLSSTGAPFTINLYPFITLELDPNFPMEFAFLDGTGVQIVDGPNTYTNVFDASFDLLVSALRQAGLGDMEIIIGEAGWPTDAHIFANPSNARRFNQALVNRILGGGGTPLRPQSVLHAYIFGLFDEDKKSVAPGPFERHWGLFEYDGQPKYPLDTTGSNNPNAMLKNVSKVEYLPARYCVLKPGRPVPQDQIDFACSIADCTSLGDGGSCAFLTPEQKASYAFNSYYQYNNQSFTSCDFQGNGIPTTEDPSTQSCRFDRQIRMKSSSVCTRQMSLVLVGLMWLTLAFI